MRNLIVLSCLFLLLVGSVASAQSVSVETNSGDAYQGDLKGLFREGLSLETSSGPMELRWSNIVVVRSSGNVGVQFGEGEQIQVRVVGVEEDKLVVQSDHLGVLRLAIASLPLAPEPEPEVVAPSDAGSTEPKTPLTPKGWNGTVTLTGNLTSGNSDTLLFAIEALAGKQWTHDSFEVGLRVIYGETDSEESANSQYLKNRYQHFFSDRFYFYAEAELFRDKIQDITFGALAGVGVGYTIWKESDDENFSIEGGIGYRHESYEDDTESRNDITARGALVYKNIYFDVVKVRTTAEMITPMNDPSAYLARLDFQWEVPVSENWKFNNTIRMNYRNEPANDAEKLDLYIGAGLSYNF